MARSGKKVEGAFINKNKRFIDLNLIKDNRDENGIDIEILKENSMNHKMTIYTSTIKLSDETVFPLTMLLESHGPSQFAPIKKQSQLFELKNGKLVAGEVSNGWPVEAFESEVANAPT